MNKVLPFSNTQTPKTRVVIFGSFHRGYNILHEMLRDEELMKHIDIVGVATDDPQQPYVSAKKRVWRHPHDKVDEMKIELLAQNNKIPVYKGRIKPPAKPLKDPKKQAEAEKEAEHFRKMLKEEWKPDIIYMGTFGQQIDETIINTPPLGMFNLHPSDEEPWPSCVGPQPFEEIFKKHEEDARRGRNAVIVLHHVNEEFDNGDMACCSEKIPVPYEDMKDMELGEKVVYMHRHTSPAAGRLAVNHLRSQIGLALKPALKIEKKGPVQRRQDDGQASGYQMG